MTANETGEKLCALSVWIDDSNAGRDAEAQTWGRLAKITEEAGEVIEAFIGATGQNPRKGVTHKIDDVVKELHDVALTALCAVEHMTDNRGHSMRLFAEHVTWVAMRAGLTSSSDPACSECEHPQSAHEMDQDGACTALVWVRSEMSCSDGVPMVGRSQRTCPECPGFSLPAATLDAGDTDDQQQ